MKGEKQMIYKNITFKADPFSYDLMFDDRITLVGGDSGTGKTVLYEILEDLRFTDEYKAIKLFNYKSDNLLEAVKQCRDNFIVIDNADILIDDDIRRFINFEFSNQYMLFLRNCDGLNVSDKEQFFSYYPIHNEAVREYGQLFEQEVSFDTCFCWIKKNTSLADEKEQSPIIFSALSYVFNREMHEIFVYSIIGLESIYAADNKGISNTLQKNISPVFPSITKDMIKKLYRMRSKFVHGEIPVGNYHLVEEIIENERDYIESSRLAVALLIATIRNLIENNATTIKFKEMISFEYDGIIG